MSDICIFCHGPLGDNPIMDENGEQACRECGLAEWRAQVIEAAQEFVGSCPLDDKDRPYIAEGVNASEFNTLVAALARLGAA